MTVNDFKKLCQLEKNGLWIYCAGDRVAGLLCDEETNTEDFILPENCNDPREMCCNFTFVGDHYSTVQYLYDYNDSEWTVMKPVWIEDWRNYK